MKRFRRTTHKDLVVWQRGISLAELIYKATRRFPSDERFGLTSQMRRAAVSVPSNIAEGAARRTSAELINFLHIARGSLAELETQAILADRLGYLSLQGEIELGLEKVGQLLNAMVVAVTRSRRGMPSDESRVTNHESP